MIEGVTFCAVYRNEAQRVRHNLDFANQMFRRKIIVVQESDDDTLKICQEYPCEIILRPAESPEESKDYIMEKVETLWTFWLDADEVPSVSVIRLLDRFDPLLMGEDDAVSFVRINYIDGHIIQGGQGDDRQYRMLRKDVRWGVRGEKRNIHVHPKVTKPHATDRVIYHHRTLEKVIKQTERWNELCSETKGACDKYVEEVKKELWQKKSQ